MKLFSSAAAMLMLAMSVLLGNSALAQTSAEASCSVLYTDSAVEVEVGAVCVTVNQDAENVFLDYLLIDDWKLSEANAWIGDNASSLPVDGSGNPQVSVFPHNASNLGDVNQHSFVIPFTELAIDAGTFCSADVIVAASAVVTRTVAGEPSGGKSDKSDKSGKGGKSDKNSKSDKSDKNSEASKGSKGNSSSAKNGKGSSHNGSSSWASNGKSDKSGKSGQSDKSGKSGQSGKSGKSGHSGKSGKSGGHNGGGTDPVTETFTAWAGDTLVGNGSYFSFSNDFCAPEEPPLITLPNSLCYNTYASFPGGAPAAFSPVGIADPATGWLNTVNVPSGSGGQFLKSSGQPAGSLTAIFTSPLAMQLFTTPPANYEVAKVNVFAGSVGSFVNVSPLSYGTSFTGAAAGLIINLTSPVVGKAELAIHAIMCPAGTGPYQ